ncbi:unnamed protein product [Amoebophrya sp. A25]|nr:unnamed protein product [Amoebophrya sp. A25]|eukprot:GSA25T00014445001.1
MAVCTELCANSLAKYAGIAGGAGHKKKMTHEDEGKPDKQKVRDEMADVLSYLVRLADVCDVDLLAAFHEKMQKNRAKYPPHLCKGRADKYTAYAEKIGNDTKEQQIGGVRSEKFAASKDEADIKGDTPHQPVSKRSQPNGH